MSKKTVYLETSFISYLTSRPSRDLIVAGHQSITHHWWEMRRKDFNLYVSEPVKDEASQGDPNASAKRLAVINDLELLSVTDEAIAFAKTLIEHHAVPAHAATDALHLGISCVHNIHYLLTWNCKHIANAERFRDIDRVCQMHHYTAPIICTPEELLGEYHL